MHLRNIPPIILLIGCGGGAVNTDDTDSNSDTDSDADTDTDVPKKEGPAYSGGTCPSLKAGTNSGFTSGSDSRTFRLELPDNPEGAPVIFAWHWLGGDEDKMVEWSDFETFPENHGAIIIAPKSRGLQYEWDAPSANAADLVFFDDMLSCLWQQYDVDLDRIYATGFSAGALWTVTLSHYRSQWLAASAPLSGGDTISNWAAEDTIPMMLTWGGPYDLYGTYSFENATLRLSALLQEDGHFVTHCKHNAGHSLPPSGEEYVWTFFEAHPKGVSPEPWAEGLPQGMPSMCSLP